MSRDQPVLGRVGIGCEPLGGSDWGDTDVDAALGAIRYAWENDVRVFDTADVYGLGLSERRLRQALGSARHEATIITKFGVRWTRTQGRAQTRKDMSPSHLRNALEASLRRLDVDLIPIYLVHWPDGKTPLEEVCGALEQQRDAGKIGTFGVSNFRSGQLRSAVDLGATVAELPLSLVERSAEADLAFCSDNGVETVAYGVYAQGLLSGKYNSSSSFDPSDRRHRLPVFSKSAWPRNEVILNCTRSVGAAVGAEPAQVALAWVLASAGVSCAVVGARDCAQVDSIIAGCSLVVPPDQLALLSQLEVGPVGTSHCA